MMSADDPARTAIDYADRWISFYAELVAITEEMLSRVGASADDGASELGMLEDSLDWLRGRLAYWRLVRGARTLNNPD